MINKRQRWTAGELQFLREHYSVMPYEEMQRRLGRSMDSIVRRANKIGLKRAMRVTPRNARLQWLRKALRLQARLSNKALAARLGMSVRTVLWHGGRVRREMRQHG